MNKPTKITPLDGHEDQQDRKPAKAERASLLERAGGAFGFDRLMPARVPAKLPEGKSVRMPKPWSARAERVASTTSAYGRAIVTDNV